MYAVALALHRWVGLALAGFLIVIGATGSVIAFFEPLDRALNPHLLEVEPSGPALDSLAVRDALEAARPDTHFYYVHFPARPDRSISFYVEGAIDAASGAPHELDHDEVFANPYSGERIGERLWGSFSLSREDLVTQLYFLHYSLVLPEQLGESFMGWVAAAWLADCFVALYLTLPRGRARGGFFSRWRRAFSVARDQPRARFQLDLHRALGLWLWPMLVVFAVSGFALNLPETYGRVISRVAGYADAELQPELAAPLVRPTLGWREARALGRRYIDEAAERHGFAVERESSLVYRREKGIYIYRVLSSRDVVSHGETAVTIDANNGALRELEIPTGDGAGVGTSLTSWAKALHMAMAFGWPWRVWISGMGLAVVALSVTGVQIWLRKRGLRARGA